MNYVYSFLPTGHEYARRVQQGARDAVAQNDQLCFRAIPKYQSQTILSLLREPGVLGGIVFCTNTRMEAELLEAATPLINVSGRLPVAKMHRVGMDNFALGRRAATHLIERGFRKLVFIGYRDLQFTQLRFRGCQEITTEQGCELIAIEYNRQSPPVDALMEHRTEPLGVIGCFDAAARTLMDEVAARGVNVPEEMAFVGMDDAEDICEAGRLTLSSVRTNGESVGRKAVEHLFRLSEGEPVPLEVSISPGPVVQRDSSNAIASASQEVVEAIRFIQRHACKGINVQDVVEAVGISQARLYHYFKEAGRPTPHKEIRTLQLDQARQLLEKTPWPLREIASRCGFRDADYFARVFRSEMSCTPTQYRMRQAARQV